jgi:hypothetical protein
MTRTEVEADTRETLGLSLECFELHAGVTYAAVRAPSTRKVAPVT